MGPRSLLPILLLGQGAAHAGDSGACATCGHAQSTGMWLTIGFLGQGIFTARFLAQWLASEKRKDSVVPVIFWWLSLAGGLTLLAYAIHRQDPVISLGQSLGVFIYVRNLMLVAKGRKRAAKQALRDAAKGPHLGPQTAASDVLGSAAVASNRST